MTKKDLVKTIRCGLISERPSIEEAYTYCLKMCEDTASFAHVTGIGVLLNTIATKIEELDNGNN